MRCDSPEAIKTAVREKLGVGILYEDAVKEELARGVFKRVPISGLQMEGNSCIAYHKQRPLSTSGEVFLNLLRQWRDEKTISSILNERLSFRSGPLCRRDSSAHSIV
jgi:DNA-binding transcriptional LysR family regulator